MREKIKKKLFTKQKFNVLKQILKIQNEQRKIENR